MAFHPTDINGILTPFLLLTNARWLQEIIDDSNAEWWLATDGSTNGYVPANFVQLL